DRKAKAGATEATRCRVVRLRERLEQAAALLRRKPDPGIGDREREGGAAGAERRRLGAAANAAARGEFQGVAHEIEQDLPHTRRIADQGRSEERRVGKEG